METFLTVVFFTLSTTTAFAECRFFVNDSNEKVTITLKDTKVIIDDEGTKTTMLRVIEKPFNVLTEAAIDSSDENSAPHYFSFLKIEGSERLVFDAQVFNPACKK